MSTHVTLADGRELDVDNDPALIEYYRAEGATIDEPETADIPPSLPAIFDGETYVVDAPAEDQTVVDDPTGGSVQTEQLDAVKDAAGDAAQANLDLSNATADLSSSLSVPTQGSEHEGDEHQ